MRAIPTLWNGTTYRSRLESRWAVVFDALGLGVTHEAEGYEHAGKCYLPDFEVDGTGQIISIKSETARLKAAAEWQREIQWQDEMAANGLPMIIIAGHPVIGRYVVLVHDMNEPAELADCRRCNGVCWVNRDGCWGEIGIHTCGDHERMPIGFDRVHAAMRKAMAERFGEREHAIEAPRRDVARIGGGA